MEYVSFILDAVFMILDSVCVLGFLLLYCYHRRKVYIWCSFLFAVFLADTFLFSMAFFLPGFDTFYLLRAGSEPVLRSALTVGYLTGYRMILCHGLDMPLKKAEYPVIAVLFLSVPLTAVLHFTPASSFLYNSFTYGYTLYFLWTGIRACRRSLPAGQERLVRYLLAALLAMELLAYLELLLWIRTGRFVLQFWFPETFQFFLFNGGIDFLLGTTGLCYVIQRVSLLVRRTEVPEKEPAPVSRQVLDEFSTAYKLTAREEEILELLASRRKNAEIAEQLHISLGTVKVHTHNIFVKAGVQAREELLAKLAAPGQVPPASAAKTVSCKEQTRL